jgi:hypothetical protein
METILFRSRIVRRLGTGRAAMAASKIAVSDHGDGTGKEVASEGARGIEAAARLFRLDPHGKRLDWGCDYEGDVRFGRMIQPRAAMHV